LTDFNLTQTMARTRIRQWNQERTALRAGRAKDYTPRGRAPRVPSTCRYDAALTRCLDFEREFGKLHEEDQQILLLIVREGQPQRVVAEALHMSTRCLSYKLPTALDRLANLLDRVNLL